MESINHNAYLKFARELTSAEQSLIKKYEDWLPSLIIDCHAHCNLPSHVNYISGRVREHMMSTFPSFSLEESYEWMKIFHPGKKILSLRFPVTFRGINHKEANSYLLGESPAHDRIALYGLPDDIGYTAKELRRARVSALKMYHFYLEPAANEIYQFFPEKLLGIAQAIGVPIILHPPVPISDCLDQLLKLVNDFPNLRVCLAHMGLTKSLVPGMERTLTILSQFPQLAFDTSQVPSADLIERAIKIMGKEKIMFGSDAPLHLIRSVPYQHPTLGRRLMSLYPYHWIVKEEQKQYGHLAKQAVHNVWQTLEAIYNAILKFPEREQNTIKQCIFYGNAKSFYGF